MAGKGKPQGKTALQIQDRIKQVKVMRLGSIEDNPRNPKSHPARQGEAIQGVVREVGWAGVPLVYPSERLEGKLAFVDGHLRKREFPDLRVRVAITDLNDQEADYLLATYDPIASLAMVENEKMEALLRDVRTEDPAVQAMLAQIAKESGIPYAVGDGAGAGAAAAARSTLAERFIVPPFSVLDARQGYWQKRKQAWIALGIQSELGRNDNSIGYGIEALNVDFYAKKRKLEKEIGRELETAEAVEMLLKSGEIRMAGDTKGRAFDNTGGPGDMGRQYNFVQGVLMKSDSGNDPEYYFKKQQVEAMLGHEISTDEFQRYYYQGPLTYKSGTSIFDPVLCELAYRWFCPPGPAEILDPFAGGSVRGVVAGYLGYRYTGIELRAEQIHANEIQAGTIFPDLPDQIDETEPVQVKVSAKMARLPFNGCDPDYIRDVCHASCCRSSTSKTGTLITIHPSEKEKIQKRGGVVVKGLLQPRIGERKCPFQNEDHLCDLHFTPDKPFGCIASPFTLNAKGTLIVRNRYRRLKCYNDGKKIPAYKAFRASLDLIFGQEKAQQISDHLDRGGGDLMVEIDRKKYDILMENDAIKHGTMPGSAGKYRPRWIVGNSLDLNKLVKGKFDFIFSCPPYYDLEVYSDLPGELSAMETYDDFLTDYRAIVGACVKRLKNNRFACFVVGDLRDDDGFYRNFVKDTIAAFLDAGMRLYNDAVLVTVAGSLPIRVGGQFQGYRKLGKTHQNVLIFYKGDPKAIKTFGDVEVGELESPDQIGA